MSTPKPSGATQHEPGEEYAGPATIHPTGNLSEPGISVQVDLRGHFEPIDGRFHWFGRVAQDDPLDAAVRSGTQVTVRTAHGTAEGRLSDVDPWGRFRLTGLGTPPF